MTTAKKHVWHVTLFERYERYGEVEAATEEEAIEKARKGEWTEEGFEQQENDAEEPTAELIEEA